MMAEQETKKEKLIVIVGNIETGMYRLTDYKGIAERFAELHPYFYDRQLSFYLWKPTKYRYEETDEIDMLNLLDDTFSMEGKSIVKGLKSNFVEALKRTGRQCLPKEPGKELIQFNNQIINIQTLEITPATPAYFFPNIIPWNIGETEETPIIDGFITGWVGKDKLELVKELISYLPYRDMPLQDAICLIGSGSNGKSVLLDLMRRFIGEENSVSSTLNQLINDRFEMANLENKLMVEVGELDYETLKNTGPFKQMTGQSPVPFQQKFKKSHSGKSYAKPMLCGNSLPPTDDDTDGYMRRWLIIEFPFQFPKTPGLLDRIPLQEYENLAKYAIRVLPALLARGSYCQDKTIDERRKDYHEASNPLPSFIEQFCEFNPNHFIPTTEFYTKFNAYLHGRGRRRLDRKVIRTALADMGYTNEKVHRTRSGTLKDYQEEGASNYFDGWAFVTIGWREDFKEWDFVTFQSMGHAERSGVCDKYDAIKLPSEKVSQFFYRNPSLILNNSLYSYLCDICDGILIIDKKNEKYGYNLSKKESNNSEMKMSQTPLFTSTSVTTFDDLKKFLSSFKELSGNLIFFDTLSTLIGDNADKLIEKLKAEAILMESKPGAYVIL